MRERWRRLLESDMADGMIYAVTVIGAVTATAVGAHQAMFADRQVAGLFFLAFGAILTRTAIVLSEPLLDEPPMALASDTDKEALERIKTDTQAQLDITRQAAAPELGSNDVAHVECYLKGGHEYMTTHIGFDRCRWCGTKRATVAQYIKAGTITAERIRAGSIKGDKIRLGSTPSLPQRSGPDDAPAVAGKDALEDVLTPAQRCEMTGHLRAMEHPECMRCGAWLP